MKTRNINSAGGFPGTTSISRRELLRRMAIAPLGMVATSPLLPFLFPRTATAQFQPPAPYGINERDRRWARIREFMSERGLDCLILPKGQGDGINLLQYAEYVSNGMFFNPGAVIFPADGDPAIVGTIQLPDSWITQAAPRGDNGVQVPLGTQIVNLVKELGHEKSNIGTVGTEAGVEGYNEFINEGLVKYATWKTVLDGLPDATFVDITGDFAAMMMVKGEEEIANIIKCAELGERLTEVMLENSGVGADSIEFKVAVEEFLIRNHATVDVRAIMLPPGKWPDGYVLNSEYGVIHSGGYCQVTLCVACGTVSKQTEELAAVAHEVMDYGAANLRAGKRFGDVIEPMEKIIRDAGYWHRVPVIHGLSPMHAVGPVYAGPTDEGHFSILAGDMEIKPGMSFSFEPGAHVGTGPMAGQVKVGATAIVTEDGLNVINKLGTRMQRAS